MPASAANMGSAVVSSREPRPWAHDAKHTHSLCRSACAKPDGRHPSEVEEHVPEDPEVDLCLRRS